MIATIYLTIGFALGGYWFRLKLPDCGAGSDYDMMSPKHKLFLFCFVFIPALWPQLLVFHLAGEFVEQKDD